MKEVHHYRLCRYQASCAVCPAESADLGWSLPGPAASAWSPSEPAIQPVPPSLPPSFWVTPFPLALFALYAAAAKTCQGYFSTFPLWFPPWLTGCPQRCQTAEGIRRYHEPLDAGAPQRRRRRQIPSKTIATQIDMKKNGKFKTMSI